MGAIAPRGRAHRAERVGSGTRLGETQRPDPLTAEQLREEARTLLVAGIGIDVAETEVLVNHPGDRKGVVRTGERLGNEAGGNDVGAGSDRKSVVEGKRGAERVDLGGGRTIKK